MSVFKKIAKGLGLSGFNAASFGLSKPKPTLKKKKICLNIGHHQKSGDSGAVNTSMGVTEWIWNESFVNDLKDKINNFDVVVVSDRWHLLPNTVNKTKAKYCVSFHCNAFNGKVSGTETLYFTHSQKGKKIAADIQRAMVEVLDLPNRGIKPRDIRHRGGALLQNTAMPTILIEPFFIDNNYDLKRAQDRRSLLLEAIARTIDSWA